MQHDSPLAASQLANLIAGVLRLGDMPPLGGEGQGVGRFVRRLADIRPGDVYWDVDDRDCPEAAYMCGAEGVVSSRAIEPWAGAFSIQTANVETAWNTIHRVLKRSSEIPPIRIAQTCRVS